MQRQPLVETDWLEAHLGDSDLRILDCTSYLYYLSRGVKIDSGREGWENLHIPGSQFVDVMTDISDPNGPYRFPLPSRQQFEESMSRLGIGDGTTVVLYDRNGIKWSTWVWWMLRNFGFKNASVLDGGWVKWIKERRLVTRDVSDIPPGRFNAKIQAGWFVFKDDVVSAMNDKNCQLIYALDPDKYEGKRIAGSRTVNAENLLDQEYKTFLSIEQLKRQFNDVGGLATQLIITYCGSGIAGSLVAFALHLVGKRSVSVYDGGLVEWLSNDYLPIETVVNKSQN